MKLKLLLPSLFILLFSITGFSQATYELGVAHADLRCNEYSAMLSACGEGTSTVNLDTGVETSITLTFSGSYCRFDVRNVLRQEIQIINSNIANNVYPGAAYWQGYLIGLNNCGLRLNI